MRRCVLLEPGFFKDFLHWAVPEWQARDLDSVQEKLGIIKVYNVQSLHSILELGSDINEKLSVVRMKGFSSRTLHAFRIKTTSVVRFCRMSGVNLYTLAGRLLATLPVEDTTTGAELMRAAMPNLEPGASVQNILIEAGFIARTQCIGALNVEAGACLQVVSVSKHEDNDIGSAREHDEQYSSILMKKLVRMTRIYAGNGPRQAHSI